MITFGFPVYVRLLQDTEVAHQPLLAEESMQEAWLESLVLLASSIPVLPRDMCKGTLTIRAEPLRAGGVMPRYEHC
jgi:hypothetical protein